MPSSSTGTMARARTTRVDCTTSCEGEGGVRAPRGSGPREPGPHFSARAPHEQGQHPHTEFWEGGTPGFQHPFCWTISAGPSTSLLVHPAKSASRFPDQDLQPRGGAPWWEEWTYLAPAQGHTHQPFHVPPTGSRPRPPAPGRAAGWWGCARRGTCWMKWIRMLGAVAALAAVRHSHL